MTNACAWFDQAELDAPANARVIAYLHARYGVALASAEPAAGE